ncbi:hypothetical protein HMPREF9372_0336 [Sporosarcina newyorkensis 2681]|uniref:Uncharacterized protein n=1 Tax=Sporosarcina newyorkensis 2681 TaxID=1027292 RepID=F9DNF6_9BACL|nr:hypothetical protein [Sporosarcina newyorkensis]EGQ27712.1 hypothetical protein HMPREF9372_0336 [Sporosarcina newyorkensis 2681]
MSKISIYEINTMREQLPLEVLQDIHLHIDETTSKRQELEFPSNIETTITDRDMLLIQIDHALDLWGRRSFYAADQCVKRNGGFGMTTETNAARLQEVVR